MKTLPTPEEIARQHSEDGELELIYSHQQVKAMILMAQKEAWNAAVRKAAKVAQLDLGERGKTKEFLATDDLKNEIGITVYTDSILTLIEE